MKNWLAKSALVCGTISLLASSPLLAQGDLPVPAAAGPAKTPALAILDPGDAAQWQTWSKDLGWRIIAPAVPADPQQAANADLRAQALDKAVHDAIRDAGVDPERVYLAGRADGTAAVFYTVARIPDTWAAALALGGSPEPAIASGRIFAANFTNTPVLWVSGGANDSEIAGRLKSAGLNLEWRAATGVTNVAVFEWLQHHRRFSFTPSIDCETNSIAFGRCFWLEMLKFDPAERNDVLPPTRINPGSGASLDLGNFGYSNEDPGPGLLVSLLGDHYSGPLKLGDRIVEFEGKPIPNAKQYTEMMNQQTSVRRVVVMVQRGKDRIRVETSVVLPRRDPAVTARVQARYDAETRQVEIVSRVVTEMKVTIPEHWVPGGLNWNGLSIEEIKHPGCLLLTMEKEILHAAVCPAQ